MGEIINVIDLAKKIKGQIIEFVSQRENNGKMIPKIASIVCLLYTSPSPRD